jgi:hypothetical protein
LGWDAEGTGVCNRFNLKTNKPQLETRFGRPEDDVADPSACGIAGGDVW